jgi:hypothetical protein
MEGMCPNCGRRPATTRVDFDEVTSFSFSSRTAGRMGQRDRSFRSTSTHGTAMLCSVCADGYERMVATRAIGRRLLNIGFLVLVIGALLFAVLDYVAPALGTGLAGLAIATPVALGLLFLLAGLSIAIIVRLTRGSRIRFLSGGPI